MTWCNKTIALKNIKNCQNINTIIEVFLTPTKNLTSLLFKAGQKPQKNKASEHPRPNQLIQQKGQEKGNQGQQENTNAFHTSPKY